MSNKFTSNVRTRLYKAGYQGYTKEEFTEAAIVSECEDLDNPTKEQISHAVNYLIEKQSSKLTVTATLPELEAEALLDQEVASESGLAPIPQAQVGEMVATKAAELGMVLSEKQVFDIADNIDSSASTFDEILGEVEAALLAYADHSANQVDAKIDLTLTKVQERVVNRHQQSRDKLAQGLTGITQALEEAAAKPKANSQVFSPGLERVNSEDLSLRECLLFRARRLSYSSRIVVGLGAIAGVLLPLHYWVYLPTNEYFSYQEYRKRKQATEQYVRRMEYHCNVIITLDKKYGCQKFHEAKESGNFQIQKFGKATQR